jgi:nicotinate-nucleotide--dimethylbenzimidazole phosphoribosyltransferase
MTEFEPAEAGPLDRLAQSLDYPDADAAHAARLRQLTLVKPADSLGVLEELSIWAAGVQGRCPPSSFENARAVIFAADHGIAAAGVSAFAPEVTAQLVALIGAGRAPVNTLLGGVPLRVVDLAVAADTSPAISAFKVRRGSGRIDIEDALGSDETARAIEAGVVIADAEIHAGADLLVAAGVGVGSSTPASTLVAVLTDTEPTRVIGRGSGISDTSWIRKCAAIRDARRRAWPHRADPTELLAVAGGAELAALTGFILQAASRRIPVLLDGLVACTAALLAQQASPRVVRWLAAGQLSAEPAHALALQRLGLTPILELGVQLEQGVGALLALPILRAATATLAGTATWDEAGISRPAP